MGYVSQDGRTMLVPDSFGGSPAPFDDSLQGAPPMPPTQEAPPPPQTSLDQLAPADNAVPAPQLAPVSLPPQSDAPPALKPDYEVAPPAPATPQQKQAAAKQAAYDASPAGLQAKANTEYDASQAAKADAIAQGVDAETAKNDEILAARTEANDKAKEIEAQKVAAQANYDKTRQQKEDQLAALQKQADDFKIDPKNDGFSGGQRVGMLIAAALSGLGNTLAGNANAPNPVLQMMKDHADQSIRLQMDQRDQLQKRASGAEHQLDRFDAFSKDKIAQFDAARATAYEGMARQVEIAGAKAANPIAKANAAKTAADLREAGAQHAQAAADRATQAEQHAQQLGIQAAQLKQSQINSDRDFNERVREYNNSLDEKAREANLRGQAGKAKTIEENRKLGVFDPSTGTSLPSEEGKKTLSLADSIEVQARKDPAKALVAAKQALDAKGLTDDVRAKLGEMKNPTADDVVNLTAQALREHANTVEVAQAPDEDAAKKLRPKLAASQNFVDQATKVRDFLRSDPNITDREGWARTQANFGNAMKNWAEANEMKFTNREAEALSEHIMSYDPSSFKDRMFSKGVGASSIDELITNIKGETDSVLKANGIKSGWTPKTAEAADTFSGQTSVGKAADAQPGALRQLSDRLTNPAAANITSTENAFGETTSKRQRDAENAAPLSSTGMDPKDESRLVGLAKQYEDASNSKRSLILSNIVAPIRGGRGDLANAMLPVIKAESPDLYRDVLKSLPPMQRDEILSRDAALAKIAPKLPPP